MKIKSIVAGNWKMNKMAKEGKIFVRDVMNLLLDIQEVSVIFAPPFTGLRDINVNPPFFKAAQNCHWEDKGAFTGEISAQMIKDCGADFIILGHSERRHLFNESNRLINKKIKASLKNELNVIHCIGETLEDRNSGKTVSILEEQLTDGLEDIASLDKLVIAYEPVWAIGTGLSATLEQIEDTHRSIRDILSKLFDNEQNVSILYGGSVNCDNAETLINAKGVDGFLIGGASLDAENFASIIKIVEHIQMRKI